MKRIRGLLIDLNGTLHVENELIGGAKNAVDTLRSIGVPLRFISNTSKESRNSLISKLQKLGLDIREEELFTSLSVLRNEVVDRKLNPYLLLSASAKEEFEGITIKEPHDSVVVGLAPKEMTYDNLNTAFGILLQGGELLASHKGRYLKTSSGIAIGPGAFVSALEYASDKQSKVIGKPSKAFFETVLRSFNHTDTSFEDYCMIGDDVRDDALAAKDIGLNAVLVKTGKYREGDENKYGSGIDMVVSDFEEFVSKLLSGDFGLQL